MARVSDPHLDRPMRYGLVVGNHLEAVKDYLPSNYRVMGTVQHEWMPGRTEPAVVIGGRDHHGWTLDKYIIPRLGSGLMRCDEIDLSHPVMSQIPLEA